MRRREITQFARGHLPSSQQCQSQLSWLPCALEGILSLEWKMSLQPKNFKAKYTCYKMVNGCSRRSPRRSHYLYSYLTKPRFGKFQQPITVNTHRLKCGISHHFSFWKYFSTLIAQNTCTKCRIQNNEGLVVMKFSSVKGPHLAMVAEPELKLGSNPEHSRLALWVFPEWRERLLNVVSGTCRFLPLSKPLFSHYNVEIIIPTLHTSQM